MLFKKNLLKTQVMHSFLESPVHEPQEKWHGLQIYD